MNRLALTAAMFFALTPAYAQETPEDGIDLMGEAMRLFMRGLMAEMEPALDDLADMLDSIDSYHPPEVLPNGDIIIRRKTPLEKELEDEIGEDGAIDL